MDGNRRHAMVLLGSLLGAAVLSGVAAAGNPNGAAPGQAKQQASPVTASASVSGKATARGRAKHQATTSSTASTSAAGNAAGVKASSTTSFNTHAAAGSSATKLYGNGSTAGQIAEQNGAGASTTLYGPGNSQPHKAALCSTNGKAHLVDVHALKAHGASSCVAGATSSSESTRPSSLGSVTGSVSGSAHRAGVGAKAVTRGKARAATRTSGVQGVHHSLAGSVSAQAKPAQAVLGAANFTG